MEDVMSETTTQSAPRNAAGDTPAHHLKALADAVEMFRPVASQLGPLATVVGRLLSHADTTVKRVLYPAPEPRATPVPVYETDAEGVEWVTLPNGRKMRNEDFEKKLKRLLEPFREDEHELRPQQVGQDKDRFQCRAGTQASADGVFCGGYHSRSVHLTYIGHAGITDRLNEVDPFWSVDFKRNALGGPLVSDEGVLWGRMTVLGITHDAVGDTGRQTAVFSGNAQKELIGDLYRNGAMRFGVGTYLWSKSEAAAQKRSGEWELKQAQEAEANARRQAQLQREQDAHQAEVARGQQDNQAEASQTRPHPNSERPTTVAPGSQTRLVGNPENAPTKRRPKTEQEWVDTFELMKDATSIRFEGFGNAAVKKGSGCPQYVIDQLDEQMARILAREAQANDEGPNPEQ